MILLIEISISILLGVIFIQDLKYRGIYWFLPFLLFGLLAYLNYIKFGLVIAEIVLYNLAIISLFTCLLLLYFLFRYGKEGLTNLKSQLGLGDVLFVLAITPLFIPQNFILFLTLSFAFALLIGGLMILIKKWKTIPLCGLQSLCLISLYLINSNLFI